MSKLKYEATDSRGKVHKRASTHRIYTHCVVAHQGAYEGGINKYGIAFRGSDPVDHVEWAGRLDLAQNVARRWRHEQARTDRYAPIESVEILDARRV